ncbi:unnamed protein product [Effrenium voratum]|uniref:Pentatricopeptide repeat-containing protein n=1 Tax=Effrenium voratum TaxID=2562239 RepID=A0AA36JCF8_9DINO|nr:unnamed protein product [Effrenium voratum]
MTLARSRKWQAALSALRRRTGLSPKIAFTAVASASLRVSEWQIALDLLTRDLALKGVSLDQRSYCTALTACERGLQWRKALLLFEEMRRQAIQSNDFICSAAISACGKSTKWPTSLRLLRELTEALEPCKFSINAVIHALARGREWQRSLHLLELFKGDVVTFNAALAALSGSALWSHALAIFEEMPIRRCDPDVVSVNTVASACERGSAWRRALAMLRDASESQVDLVALGVEAAAHGRAQHWAVAVAVLAKTQAMQLQRGRGANNSFLGNIVLSACDKAAEWEAALAVLESMKVSKAADLVSFNTCISASATAARWHIALAEC